MSMRIDAATAVAAVRAYNVDSYRGQSNLEVDRRAYERFRGGLPDDEPSLLECVRFVGQEYGGAQRRFLPHGYREEAMLIVAELKPVLNDWRLFVNGARPLADEVPDEIVLSFLFQPFSRTMRWPVWASKTLHFLRPDVFPILDSKAKKTLGMPNLASTPRDYHKYCSAVCEAVAENQEALVAAREIDGGTSPSDLKLLDKVLYQLGK